MKRIPMSREGRQKAAAQDRKRSFVAKVSVAALATATAAAWAWLFVKV